MTDYTTRQYHGNWEWPDAWDGMDYETAEACTPKLYGVSFGNGNDGVSQMFADYYVRTSDPWLLARAAMLGSFKAEWMAAANDALEIDGAADYTISVTIYNPEDVDPSEGPEPEYRADYHCPDCEHVWEAVTSDVDEMPDCPKCASDNTELTDSEELEIDGDDSYSAANGAWSICEVFRETEPREGRPMYDSIEECFGADAPELVLARESE